MTLVKSPAPSVTRPRSPVVSSRPLLSAKGVSPLAPPSMPTPKTNGAGAVTQGGPMSPSTTNGASPSIRSSAAGSKFGTPTCSARGVVSGGRSNSAAVTPRMTPRTGAVASAVAQSPVITAPKVPLLHLRTSISPSPSVDHRLLANQQAAADGIGVAKKAKPCITVKKQEPCLIFTKAETPKAPRASSTAFACKHIHSDPFSKDRQQPITPSKKTSVPRPLDNVSAPSARTSGRKVGANILEKTNPICQDDPVSLARARSPSSGRSHGACAPPAHPAAPTDWMEGPSTPSRLHLGKRCNSAPATSRCADDLPRRGISVTCNKREGTLKGVWIPEARPVKSVEVRAPYAQATPRASTPSATARKLSAPFATNTPRGVPALRQAPPSLTAPYHTTTPRGATPKSSFRPQAPFHTTTPRGVRAAPAAGFVNNIIQ